MKSNVSSIGTRKPTGNGHRLWRGIALTGVLPVALGLLPHPALAVTGADGSQTTGAIVLDDFPSWTTIRNVSVNLAAGTHQCVATASTDALNPGGGGNHQLYNFMLSRDDANPFTPNSSERTAELSLHPGMNDPDVWPVATNLFFGGVPAGTHIFYFLGRENVQANPNMTLHDSVLSVVCFQGNAL